MSSFISVVRLVSRQNQERYNWELELSI